MLSVFPTMQLSEWRLDHWISGYVCKNEKSFQQLKWMRWCLGVWKRVAVRALRCGFLELLGGLTPPKMSGCVCKHTLLVQRGGSGALPLALPTPSMAHWAQGNFFSSSYFSQVYLHVLLPRTDIAQGHKKKRVPDKKWDLVDTPETRHCNMLITLSLNLVMSNIQAQDDLRRKREKHWGGKRLR